MGATTPDGIAFPDTGSSGGFRTLMAAMATSVQNALKSRISKGGYRYATAALRDVDWPSATTPTGTRTRIDTDLFDREWNGTSWLPVGAGLLSIKPSGVSGTGVSLTGGAVSWSGGNSIQVNDCFPGGFDGYKIIGQSTFASNEYLRLGFQTLGTAVQAVAQQSASNGTSTTNAASALANVFNLGGLTVTRAFELDIILLPDSNLMMLTGQVVDSAGTVTIYDIGARAQAIATGIQLISGSAVSHAGRMEFYGYRQNTV